MENNTPKSKWLRVSRGNPCPVCGRGDWCLVADDRSAAICPRISEGAQKDLGEAGFLHILDAAAGRPWRPGTVTAQQVKTIDTEYWRATSAQYQSDLTPEVAFPAAEQLGLEVDTLLSFGMGYDGQAATFPMFDANHAVIGIHRRFPDGRKCSVRDSSLGLFCPRQQHEGPMLFVPEGLTDTMTAYELGLPAVGRASCNVGADSLSTMCRGLHVVVVGDNDEPGRCGARSLTANLALVAHSVRVVFPPAGIKDLRDWRRAGACAADIQQLVDGTAPIRVRITFGGLHG